VDVLIGKPAAHGVEQSVGGFLIVAAFEKTPKPAPLVILQVVAEVQNPGDPPNDLAVAIGEKCLDGVAIVEGMRPIADQFLLRAAERGNPIRGAAIKRPRKAEELPLLPGGLDALDNKLRHAGRL